MSRDASVEVELDLAGAALGPWRLERLLGEGAMARVYRARHVDGRPAAVKVLRRAHAGDPELVQRFVREARAVDAVKHPHIVEVYDFGEQRGPDGTAIPWQAMELLEGRLLADACEAGPVPAREAARIGLQVTWALDAAHRVGVVHRDLKPENIVLHGPGEQVKVLDFGMAKLLEPLGDLPRSGTLEGVVLGTPEYMAPEQALGQRVDRRADLYSVGVILFELLVGARPFRGDTFGKLLVEVTSRPAPPLPPTLRSGEPTPPGLAALVERCLAKSPDQRFASAAALAAALAPFAGLPATPPVPPRAVAEPDEAALAAAVKGAALPKVLAALVGVALLAGVLALLLR